MDSTLTLVSPNPIQLDFDKNSVKNATLSVDGTPLYTLTTPDNGTTSGLTTHVVNNYTKERVVTISYRDILPDIVTFADHNNGKAYKLKKWLKVVKLDDGSETTLMEVGTEKYYWKLHPIHRFALYPERDFENPVAHLVMHGGNRISLVMEHGTESFRDMILASILIVELRLRTIEKKSNIGQGIWRSNDSGNADSKKIIASSLSGMYNSF